MQRYFVAFKKSELDALKQLVETKEVLKDKLIESALDKMNHPYLVNVRTDDSMEVMYKQLRNKYGPTLDRLAEND
jgi:hypothetical protein